MSDALDYLTRVRPEAMGHYFAFLKASGGSLDPKTRALISVITKVAAQTERGFRQYLRRALREGATAAEVLDALLMAFPALGLTKIVWAVDQILALDLPEFSPDALAGGRAWHAVAPLAELPEGPSRRAVAGHPVWVVRAGEAFRIWDTVCPHQGTAIVADPGPDGSVECQRHGWRFDVREGRCSAGGDRPLTEIPARVRGALLEGWR